MIFLAYLPFVHRYITKAIFTEGIYHFHQYFQSFKSFIQRRLPRFTNTSVQSFIMAPTTRRTASANPLHDQPTSSDHVVPPLYIPNRC